MESSALHLEAKLGELILECEGLEAKMAALEEELAWREACHATGEPWRDAET